jgi:hypothetical protein
MGYEQASPSPRGSFQPAFRRFRYAPSIRPKKTIADATAIKTHAVSKPLPTGRSINPSASIVTQTTPLKITGQLIGTSQLVRPLFTLKQRSVHNETGPRAVEHARRGFPLRSPPRVRIRLSQRTRIRRFDRPACPHGPTAHRLVRGSSVHSRSCSVLQAMALASPTEANGSHQRSW